MAKQRKGAKVKEPVTIRQKLLFKGTTAKTKDEKAAMAIEAARHPHKFYWSLYLDIYKDGKRSYKFLGLQLVPELDGDQFAKVKNENTMNIATQIKAQEILLLESGQATQSNKKGKILLSDWLESYREKRIKDDTRARADLIHYVSVLLKEYKPNIMLKDIDKEFCLGFIDYMRNEYTAKKRAQKNEKQGGRKQLAENSIKCYFDTFASALSYAERQGEIAKNPVRLLENEQKPKKTDGKKEFLTIEEIGQLIKTPCNKKHEEIKQAYLFSCFCGLRMSDTKRLIWENLYNDGNSWKLSVTIKKTRKHDDIYLSDTAMNFLPDRGTTPSNKLIFNLPTEPTIENALKNWAKAAGINKNLTYHTSRHTCATMLLTLGADLYTVSKLLGHSDIKTTQIYAKIVDEKKKEAVNLTNGLFPTMPK